MPSDRTFTAEEVDAAVAALTEPGRLDHAQDVITHAAPALQQILAQALHEGGFFDGAHEQEVQRVASGEDPQERAAALRVLLAEETRIGMLIGAAVGFQLALELASGPQAGPYPTPEPPNPAGDT